MFIIYLKKKQFNLNNCLNHALMLSKYNQLHKKLTVDICVSLMTPKASVSRGNNTKFIYFDALGSSFIKKLLKAFWLINDQIYHFYAFFSKKLLK